VICHDHRCIFVHVERTGGTSIEIALSGFDWWERRTKAEKHLTAVRAIARYGSDAWSRYFTFGLVRNPWDLVVSSYEFFQVRHSTGLAFRDFVLSSADPSRRARDGWTHASWWREGGRCQLDWLSDDRGELLVDFIGRFERLAEDFAEICRRLSIPSRPLPHESRMRRGPYAGYYDEETRRRVAEIFARDVERFGYTF
jgi:chondroitin 4-sulfotransferase 11